VLSTSLYLWLAPINAQVHTRRPVLSGMVEVNNGGQWKGKQKRQKKTPTTKWVSAQLLYQKSTTAVMAVWSKSLYAFQSKISPDWICIIINLYILQPPSLNYSKVFISCGNLQHTTHLRLILGLLCQPPILRRVCNCGEPCGRVVPNEIDSKRMPQ